MHDRKKGTDIRMIFRDYIGDRSFYKKTMTIALPIMVQNGISTFVNMLDNLMVGRLGTEAMSGVSIVNQFMFVFTLLVFGAVSAAGIFMAQFHGRGSKEGERYTFRFKVIVCAASAILGIGVFILCCDSLISSFLTGDEAGVDPALILKYGREYLFIMLIGLIPFAFSNVYASSMRETGDTVSPMAASIAAVAVNFTFNYILIFGNLGAPRLEVKGAAIATVISRFAELAILAVRTHRHPERYAYIAGAFRSLKIPADLCKQIALRGLPLMANEVMWSLAVTVANQSYSTCGLDVVPAQNIFSTLQNLFIEVLMSLGSTIAIMIGNLLGAGKLEEAKDSDRKLVAFSIVSGIVTGGLLAVFSKLFPMLYNTTDSVRSLATYMIMVGAVMLPFVAFTNAAYFTIRSGGDVLVTLLFDSVFMWAVVVPLCYVLSRYTDVSIYVLFAAGQGTEIVKSVLGYVLLRKGTWVKQIVDNEYADI